MGVPFTINEYNTVNTSAGKMWRRFTQPLLTEKIEKRAVIKYLFIKGMSTKEIYDDMFLHWGMTVLHTVL